MFLLNKKGTGMTDECTHLGACILTYTSSCSQMISHKTLQMGLHFKLKSHICFTSQQQQARCVVVHNMHMYTYTSSSTPIRAQVIGVWFYDVAEADKIQVLLNKIIATFPSSRQRETPKVHALSCMHTFVVVCTHTFCLLSCLLSCYDVLATVCLTIPFDTNASHTHSYTPAHTQEASSSESSDTGFFGWKANVATTEAHAHQPLPGMSLSSQLKIIKRFCIHGCTVVHTHRHIMYIANPCASFPV